MPGPAPPAVEAQYSTRIGVWQAAYNAYRTQHCKESGEQTRSNLTSSQQIGLKTLSRKVARMEVLVLQADKGRRFVVVDEPTYLAMAMDHVSKDSETTPEVCQQQPKGLIYHCQSPGQHPRHRQAPTRWSIQQMHG